MTDVMTLVGKSFDRWIEECGLDADNYLLSAVPLEISRRDGVRITPIGIKAEELIYGLDFMADALVAIRLRRTVEMVKAPRIEHSKLHPGYKNVDCKLCAHYGRGTKKEIA